MEKDNRRLGEEALAYLVRTNPPGRISFAGAYALGYGEQGMAQLEDRSPDWYSELDALDTLFLGTAFPRHFRDVDEFCFARNSWLDHLATTKHWRDVERFIRVTVETSTELSMAVDDVDFLIALAGRLEKAGLNQRKLPSALMPSELLGHARFLQGPSRLKLEFPAGAPAAVEKFWNSVGVDLPPDGTVIDAMRDGLTILDRLDLPVRTEAWLLLLALYISLVAQEHESLEVAADRAEKWALDLPSSSPLVPVTDALLVAIHGAHNVDETLSSLLVLPQFSQQVPMSDRRWRVQLRTELVHLAFDLGYHEVRFSDHVVQRLDGHQVAGLRSQLARFEEKFGRPPGPDEPLFFDPDADEPRPVSTVELEQSMVCALETSGVSPAWIYAYQHTGGLLPRFDGSFRTESDRFEWEEVVQRYIRLHPGTEPDSEAELQRISDMAAVLLVCQVADDPQHGSALAFDLDRSSTETDHLSNYLRCREDELIDGLRTSSEVQSRALELARAWGSGELSELTSAAIEKGDGDLPDSVLLVVAAASWSQ